MKKTIKLLCVLALCLALSATSVSSARDPNAAFSWYVRRQSDHRQPTVDANMQFIGDYNCRYIGRDGEKVLYLTFDAGYENGNIAKILDVLKEKDVPGAFFILKNLIERNGDLVCRMAAEGHTVANHTMRHRDMTKFTVYDDFKAELDGLAELYKLTTGCEMAHYYRPPEGRFSESNLKFASEAGYSTVLWSFAYADWDNDRQPSEVEAMEKVLQNTHDGAVILLHPTSATNAAILGRLIDEWRKMGYRFGTLDELCSAAN